MKLLCVAMLIAAPLEAQTVPTTAPVPTTGEKKLCRRMEPDTGSQFPGKRVCRTKSEWATVDSANATGARALSDYASRSSKATINE